jgi:hypothetical protein
MKTRKHPPRIRLFCAKCGAKAIAGCDCEGGVYYPAHIAAANAIAAHPNKSNRAIAAETGIAEVTIRRARSTASNDAVEKRVGLDGKTRRMPSHSNNQITEEEKKQVPRATALIDRIMPILREMEQEREWASRQHRMKFNLSPRRVQQLAYELLTEIYECMPPHVRANACERVAAEWEIGEAELSNKDYVNDICAAAEAWSLLRDKVLAAAMASLEREVAEV